MKLYIVGSVASGKTTLASKLSKQLSIPFYELDCIVHDGSKCPRYKRTQEEQAEVIAEINQESDWIIEGTYRKSCHMLFEIADCILFLDPQLFIRKYRIFKRFMKQQLGIEKSHYKSDLRMLKLMYKWTRDFENDREDFEELLGTYHNKLIIAKSRDEAMERLIFQEREIQQK